MSLRIHSLRAQKEEKMAQDSKLWWVSDRRLWLTADRERVVEDGDPEARTLLTGGPGVRVPRKDAERWGLVKPAAEPKPKAAAKSPNKARAKSANKAK